MAQAELDALIEAAGEAHDFLVNHFWDEDRERIDNPKAEVLREALKIALAPFEVRRAA